MLALRLYLLGALLFVSVARPAAAQEAPPTDSPSTDAPSPETVSEGVELPKYEPAPRGERDRVWSRSSVWEDEDPVAAHRQEHLRLTSAAFGGAGAMTGLAGLVYLSSLNQPLELQPGWQIASGVIAGIAAIALGTGVVLWLQTPAPVIAGAAPIPGGGALFLQLRL